VQPIADELKEFFLDWLPHECSVVYMLNACSIAGRIDINTPRDRGGAYDSLVKVLVGLLGSWRGLDVRLGPDVRTMREDIRNSRAHIDTISRQHAEEAHGEDRGRWGPSRWFDCKDCVDALRAYLDGEMTSEDEARFKAHVEDCPPCKEFLETYLATIGLARKALGQKMPEELSQKIKTFKDEDKDKARRS
jgi:anti-sigma factor (TIGR02949 family)